MTAAPKRLSYKEALEQVKATDLSSLNDFQKKELVETLEAIKAWEDEHQLELYRPYAKQKEFHAAGASNRERLLMAANQCGKTYSAAAEVAMHLTGLYPDWWEGKRFLHAPRIMAAGMTSQLVRDSMQVLLCGIPQRPLGHGMVPKASIVGDPTMAKSITGAIDFIKVQHSTGGESILYFRSYDQGRERVQAMTLDAAWLDEEPDLEYYTECMTRTNVASGPVFMTFTPLKGLSDVVSRFLHDKHGHVTNMTIEDVDHYTREQKDAIIAQYPPHERDARTKGIPMLGSGKVFPVMEEKILVTPFEIPPHWPRIVGFDIGWQHPTAAVWVAHDRDTDTVYVYDAYRAAETIIPIHAAMIKSKGAWIPVAYPHDGAAVKDFNQGLPIAEQYRQEGVAMRPMHATLPETGLDGEGKMSRISTEAGIQIMLTRMETGRFKVFSHLSDWLEEFRGYHRKDGLLVKVRDDLMSATRMAIFDLRFAITKPSKSSMIDHKRRSSGLYGW